VTDKKVRTTRGMKRGRRRRRRRRRRRERLGGRS
jgi:hypothetical protein